MSNMSYCRFENTLPDLEDCKEALYNLSNLNELSETEMEAARELIKACVQISEDFKYMIEK